jgi:hypothetical protein
MAIDAIEVLDNLQFEQLDTTEIWAIDGEGSAFDAVKSYAVVIPPDISAARVIFNNWYDTAACQVCVRVKMTKLTGISTLAKTENTQVLEWTAIEPAVLITGGGVGFLDSGVIDLSAAYSATIHIDCALTSAVAHTGTEIIVQVRSEDATPDEWTTLTSFVGPTGTPFHLHPSGTAAAAQKTILVANPTAGNLNHIGKFLFLKNATIANSEKVYITQCGADA